jgi:hypothetical protein
MAAGGGPSLTETAPLKAAQGRAPKVTITHAKPSALRLSLTEKRDLLSHLPMENQTLTNFSNVLMLLLKFQFRLQMAPNQLISVLPAEMLCFKPFTGVSPVSANRSRRAPHRCRRFAPSDLCFCFQVDDCRIRLATNCRTVRCTIQSLGEEGGNAREFRHITKQYRSKVS